MAFRLGPKQLWTDQLEYEPVQGGLIADHRYKQFDPEKRSRKFSTGPFMFSHGVLIVAKLFGNCLVVDLSCVLFGGHYRCLLLGAFSVPSVL